MSVKQFEKEKAELRQQLKMVQEQIEAQDEIAESARREIDKLKSSIAEHQVVIAKSRVEKNPLEQKQKELGQKHKQVSDRLRSAIKEQAKKQNPSEN